MTVPEALMRAAGLFLITCLPTALFDNGEPAEYAEMLSQLSLKPCLTCLT